MVDSDTGAGPLEPRALIHRGARLEGEGYSSSAGLDSVRAAQRALNAARQALHDARERAEAGAPDTEAAMDDAARRYERAMALLRAAPEPGGSDRRVRADGA